MSESIRSISCAVSDILDDKYNRPITHGTSDGLNHITSGKVSGYNGDLVHTVMALSTIALFSPKTRAIGVAGWIGVGILWLAGQNENAVRPRKRNSFCK